MKNKKLIVPIVFGIIFIAMLTLVAAVFIFSSDNDKRDFLTEVTRESATDFTAQGTNWYCMIFNISSGNYIVRGAEIGFSSFVAGRQLRLDMRSTNDSGLPSTILISNYTINSTMTGDKWYNISFGEAAQITNGTRIALCMNAYGGSTAVYANVSDEDPKLGNVLYTATGLNTSWSIANAGGAPKVLRVLYEIWGINGTLITPTAYETQTRSYNTTFNVSGSITPSGYLYFDGTRYDATATLVGGINWRFSRTLQIPASSGLKNVSWQIYNGTAYYNTSANLTQYQEVNSIDFGSCGLTTDLSNQFVNFTFKDESDLSTIQAAVDSSTWSYWLGDGTTNKSYTFSNTTSSKNVPFCFTPADKSVNVDLTFKYSNTSYSQRTFSYSSQALTNTTTSQVLYLLKSSEGIYSSVSVIRSSGTGISAVGMTLERYLGSSWVTIETGSTDSSGLFTAFVNPNYDYRITASKTGYLTSQVTIRPSQSFYTLTLTSSEGNASYNSPIEGLKWAVSPSSGTLDVKTTPFNATVISSSDNLENCKLEIVNSTNISQVFATTTGVTNATYCYLSLTYATIKDVNLFGRLSVDTTSTSGFVIVDADWKWIVIDLNKKSWRGISSFFEELKNLDEFGEGNEGEFSRFMFFFLIVTIFIGIFTYLSGYEIQNPGYGFLLMFLLVLIASLGGFLQIESGAELDSFWKKYSIVFLMGMFALGWTISQFLREETA